MNLEGLPRSEEHERQEFQPADVEVVITQGDAEQLPEELKREFQDATDFAREIRITMPDGTESTCLIPSSHLVLGDLADRLDDEAPISYVREAKQQKFSPETWSQIGYRKHFTYQGTAIWSLRHTEDGGWQLPPSLEPYKVQPEDKKAA